MNIFTIIYAFLLLCTIGVITYFVYTLYAMWSAAPFVPMSEETVANMMQLLQLTEHDVVVDLGSGDGRAVFAAAHTASKATGVEINPILYYWSCLRQYLGKHRNTRFIRTNLWEFDMSEANVVILFFIPGKMHKLAQKLTHEMKSGSRIASYGFRFSDWQPEQERDKIRIYRIP